MIKEKPVPTPVIGGIYARKADGHVTYGVVRTMRRLPGTRDVEVAFEVHGVAVTWVLGEHPEEFRDWRLVYSPEDIEQRIHTIENDMRTLSDDVGRSDPQATEEVIAEVRKEVAGLRKTVEQLARATLGGKGAKNGGKNG